MPFLQEVVIGKEGPLITLEGRTVDPSVVFPLAAPGELASLEASRIIQKHPEATAMDAPAFCSVLNGLSAARPSTDGTLAWGGGDAPPNDGTRHTTLDPSQCAALSDILSRRVAVIQVLPRWGWGEHLRRGVQCTMRRRECTGVAVQECDAVVGGSVYRAQFVAVPQWIVFHRVTERCVSRGAAR